MEAASRDVVVIEDSPVQAERLRRVVELAGFTPHVAHDGDAGIELVFTMKPWLVLADLRMPGTDGLDVTRRIRESTELEGTVVVVITIADTPSEVLRILEAGADDFIAKPYDEAEVVERIHRNRALGVRRGPRGPLPLLLSALDDAAAARRRADEANRAKADFLATIAHELRTPLNAIRGWVDMLQGGTLDAARHTHGLTVIARNTAAQTRLIDDLLDTARIDAGELRIEAAPVDVAATVVAAAEAVEPFAASRGVEIVTAATPGPIVLGDAGRLQQVVSNLLNNAVKVSPPGASVELSMTRADGGVAITVRDHGRGIAPAQLGHVFERFRQTHPRTRGETGLGLGLSIVHHLVRRHAGRISAESEGLGQGATFRVWLPEMEMQATTAAPPGVDTLFGTHVLVVDDHEDMLLLATTILRRAGAMVVSAKSADEALALVVKDQVVVTDLSMPGRSGFDLARAIRARAASTGGVIPILALTGLNGDDVREEALRAGIDVVLHKPIETAALVRAVAMMVPRPAGDDD